MRSPLGGRGNRSLDIDRHPFNRPELSGLLREGDAKIDLLMEERVELRTGALLVAATEEHPFVYRLRRGWFARQRRLEDGRNKLIMLFLPGDLFAVKSMFLTEHPDEIIALSDCEAERVRHPKLRAAFENDADVATRCICQVLEEERRLHNWVVSLGRGSALERLAMLLLDLRGRLALQGLIAPGALGFDLPMTQEQIGDHLGVSTVHVNRVLKTLRERNVAVLSGHRASIEDLEALALLARPLLDDLQRSSPVFMPPEANRK